MTWIWQRDTWPDFSWDERALVSPLTELARATGRLFATVEGLGLNSRDATEADALTEEAVRTSNIEGHTLPPASVRSSVARRLGLESGELSTPRRDVDGLVGVLLDVTRNHQAALTVDRLQGWHAALFPDGRSGFETIAVGAWRHGPVSVRSGPFGRERIHFEGPPPERVPGEIRGFLEWWAESRGQVEGVVRAGIAHLRFETIHPFEDGNGRIGRAIADLALAQTDASPRRYYSVSQAIHSRRAAYYRHLEEAQRGALELTSWLQWFVDTVHAAVRRSLDQVLIAQTRQALRLLVAAAELNPRQLKVMNALIETEPDGWEGGLSNANYRSIAKTSKATAARDLADLVERGLLAQSAAGGRSTRYRLGLKLSGAL